MAIIVIRTSMYVRIKVSKDGECSPYAPINGETIDICFLIGEVITRKIGSSPCENQDISTLIDLTIYGNTSIKSAIDIPCYDMPNTRMNPYASI